MAEFLNNASWWCVGFMFGYILAPWISVLGKILNNAVDATIKEHKKQK